nr:MAG TPA: hypothetical protein [Caudoviricetes sp.]
MMYPRQPTKPTPIEDVSAGTLIIREGATWRVESNSSTPGRPAYRTLTLRGGRAGTQRRSYATAPAGSIVIVRTN